MDQNLTLSFFAYYSPSDRDAYLRPKVTFKASDSLRWELGGNVFIGRDDHTFFGQFEGSNNIYLAVRWGF